MLYVLQYVYLLLLIGNINCEFWLSAGMSGYTVIRRGNRYTELVIHSPEHQLALVITDYNYIVYDKYRSYHCRDNVCGIGIINYHTMRECALNDVGVKEIVDNNGNLQYARRKLEGHQEVLVDFRIRNITDDEALARITHLINEQDNWE